jgi:ribosomal protein L16 Arg81 hydroxylase
MLAGPFVSLLDPVTLSDFIRDYWEQQPIHVSGHPSKFSGLLDRQALLELLKTDPRGVPSVIGYLKAGREEYGQHFDFQTSVDRAESLLAAGFTLQIEDIDRYIPVLGDLVLDCRRALAIPSRMNVACFLSPVGSGYGLHFDASAMWVMQLSGRKHWWYSPTAAIAFPVENSIPTTKQQELGIHGYRPDDLVEQILSPGDVLYLPAGVWHRVHAVEESLHLCLSLFPATAFDLFAALLREKLLACEEWRRPFTCGVAPLGAADVLEREVQRLLANRLDEMRGILERLDPDELLRLWQRQTGCD